MDIQEKILKTALHLFFKYGIKHVTMDDIAKELGISKKTIYQFYKEKDDLVTQLCENEMKHHEHDFQEFNKSANDPIHEMILISNKMKTFLQNINPMFFIDLKKFYPTAFARFQSFKENFAYKNTLSNLKEGIAQGYYRSNIEPEFVSHFRLNQIEVLMFGNTFSFEKVSFAKSYELTLDMFVYGICTLKGHKLFDDYKKLI